MVLRPELESPAHEVGRAAQQTSRATPMGCLMGFIDGVVNDTENDVLGHCTWRVWSALAEQTAAVPAPTRLTGCKPVANPKAQIPVVIKDKTRPGNL